MIEDADLVTAAQAGDRRALEALLRAHHDRVLAVCRRVTGNDADAHDATQEALIAVVRGLPRFDGRSSFSTWVYRVASNAAIDEVRRRRRRPLGAFDDVEAVIAAPVHVEGGVVDRLDIDAALAMLPAEFRIPVVLRDLIGMDYAEIAATLSLPPGTVRSRISRGRAALARLLGEPTPSEPRHNEQP